MKKLLCHMLLAVLLALALTGGALAAGNKETVKVGLYYGSNALYSANLENYAGSGYRLGWFDETTREFTEVGRLDERAISMTADGTIYISGGSYSSSPSGRVDRVIGGYHVELADTFATFEEAKYVAGQFAAAFPAYIGGAYTVRVGSFASQAEAEVAAATYSTYIWYDLYGGAHSFVGRAVSPSSTGVTITVTKTDKVLFHFDCYGARNLGIQPGSGPSAGKTITWFKGYKWHGGFEYRRSTGGNINVINVVPLDDYVRGVLPYEMSTKWPLEALKAQAVCARSYALLPSKHYKSYGFDICNTTDCQVYRGVAKDGAAVDRAVDETAGMVATYMGQIAETYYYSSNGGASESSENVWSKALPYLVGKEDPYEAMTNIPDYRYQETYTYDQLTRILQSKKYQIGQVSGVYISRYTPTGNVAEITFTDTSGRSLRITGEKCKTVFYTTLFGGTKSVKSMRFSFDGSIGGGGGGGIPVNGGGSITSLSGAYAITGDGSVFPVTGSTAITSSGITTVTGSAAPSVSTGNSGNSITITGIGSGHNVGMSQYGAKAMAEMGMSYMDILQFYFTGITIERVGYGY